MAAANHNHKPDLAANTLLNTTEMTPSSIPELKASAVDRSLDYFATMTIHGLANKTNGSPEILRLDRVPTFPGLLARTVPVIPYEWPRSMSAHSLTECHLHLELRIGQLIGSGRVGSVYGVDVVKAISDDISFDTNTFISQLPRLCLKVSTPTHCRGLAREAWVYEQLGAAKLTGTVTARCYGPFNANLQDHDAVVPSWSKEFENWFEKCKDGRDDLQDDWDDGAFFTDDSQSSRSASPWNTWRANKDYPEVTVMLLERLGSTLEENEYESNEADIMQVVDDLSEGLIEHCDLRYNNIVRAPPTFPPCTRHGHRHGWCIIDFDCARLYTTRNRASVLRQRDQLRQWHDFWKYNDEWE